ncbi:MAG: CPBP family intramembrane metalloprotease [Candidatus Aminicenantes bacterium]|nr:CPBP family intramembrane metalloprotease [Candidatus Aminicenantes bacterium]
MFAKKVHINPYLYIPFVLALTWGAWLLAVATGRGVENLAVKVLLVAGLLSPALVALAFILLGEDAEYHWDYWRRVFDPTLISKQGFRLIFFLPLVVIIVSILASLAFGGQLSQLRLIPQVRAHIPSILFFLFYNLFIGPFPEELGWRGYWLDKLCHHLSGLKASLLVGLVWAFWHLPLFLMRGYILQARYSHPLLVVLFFIELFPKSIILTYLFFKNKRSTLAAILFHFMINFVNQLFVLNMVTAGIQTILYLMIAFYLIAKNKEIFQRKTTAS